MSGQVLREAAVLMRRRAEWANQGPWKREADHTGHFDIVADGTGPLGGDFVSLDAEHIASWHPEVALAEVETGRPCRCGHPESEHRRGWGPNSIGQRGSGLCIAGWKIVHGYVFDHGGVCKCESFRRRRWWHLRTERSTP